MSKLNEAFTASLTRVQVAELRLAAFQWAMKDLRRYAATVSNSSINQAMDTIWGELYREALDEYRDMFMMAHFADKAATQEAKRRAWKTFLSERKRIMRLLDVEGVEPGIIKCADEAAFRAQFREVLDGDAESTV